MDISLCEVIVAIANFTLAFLNVQAAEDALPRIVEIMATQLQCSKAEKKVNTHYCCVSMFLT